MPKPKSKKKNTAHLDWISSLARENASNNDGSGAQIPSKEDRKRKRESKKNRRMEQQKQKQLQKIEQQQRRQKHASENYSEHAGSQQSSKPLGKARKLSSGSSSPSPSSLSIQQQSSRSLVLRRLSKPRIVRLSKNIQNIRKDLYEKNGSTKTRFRPFYDLPRGINEKGPRTSHSYAEAASLTKKRKRKWNEDSIQPLKSDYSGIGVARISMYIEFLDPSYYPKLEEEFQEHIPGFFGKQRTKAMKKQTDGNMLWRRLANEKKNNNKKFKRMTADERVQAMIDSSGGNGLLG